MKREYFFQFGAAFLFILLFACNSTGSTNNGDTVTIGTFNIQWLGDGDNDLVERSSEDYRIVAEIIKNTGADILALQEIENSKALDRLTTFLPGWKYCIGSSGNSQNAAFLFKETITVRCIGEYTPLALEANRHRPGLIVECKAGNFDWIMMAVHFKSTSRYDDTEEKKLKSIADRTKQAEISSLWASETLESGNEKDIIILGDFNDSPNDTKDPSLTDLIANKDILFLTDGMKSCKYQSWNSIDHIVVSVSTETRYIKSSAFMYDINSVVADASKISDHCPVTAVFDITETDND